MDEPAARRPPGRGARVRAAVLGAALAELAEVGYDALTVEAVARRAGVHKTTVYRRWADRADLVVDALTEHVDLDVAVPAAGPIEDDLRAYARSVVAWLTAPTGRAVLAALLSDAARVPEVAEVKQRFFTARMRRAEPLVARAVARGELPAGTEPGDVVRALVAPIYLRLVITGEPVDDTTADAAARDAIVLARSAR
jgi:AcrR family transcriptional regulator